MGEEKAYKVADGRCGPEIVSVDIETVDLIAKGYEWNCPYCADLNQTYEAREIYFCGKCGMKVKAEPPDHCYE